MEGNWVDRFIESDFKEWENDTFDTFEKVKNPNGVAIDIGAWIGTTCIWLSKNFAYVVAVEADTKSLDYLKKNLVLSECENVIVCDKALSNDGKPVVFGPRLSHGDALNGSTSYIKSAAKAGDSRHNYVISSMTLEQIVHQYINGKQITQPVTFIKCDIEGGEESVLADILDYALKHRCSVWMSFHYTWWSEKNITKHQALFSKFDSNCPKDICEYIKENPFGSVLFIPK